MVAAPLAFGLPPLANPRMAAHQCDAVSVACELASKGALGGDLPARALRQRQLATFMVQAQRASGKRRLRFASDSERPLISEQSGRSAGVYEHDILVLPAAIADE